VGPRSRTLAAGLLGAAIATATIALCGGFTGSRDRSWRLHEEATRAFLDVPSGAIHLRAVPDRADFLPVAVRGPGSVDLADDAAFELLRDETSRWFVHLVEVAVPQLGTLTLSVVDRPAADGSSRSTVAELRRRVEPARACLVGFGLDGAGAPLEYVGGPRDPTPARRTSRRLRLLLAGGSTIEAEPPGSRTRVGLDPLGSAWGPVSLVDVDLDRSGESTLEALSPSWIAGPDLGTRGHRSGTISTPLVLGVVPWMPDAGSASRSASWINGRIVDTVGAGPFMWTRTESSISLAVDGKPAAIDAFPHPAWVVRITFDPDAR
jgi:hypothetical protein